jgi:ribosomal protein L22
MADDPSREENVTAPDAGEPADSTPVASGEPEAAPARKPRARRAARATDAAPDAGASKQAAPKRVRKAAVPKETEAQDSAPAKRPRVPRVRRTAAEQTATESPSTSQGTAAGKPRAARKPAGESSAAAPSSRRSRRKPTAPARPVTARARYVRSSARKARLVCNHIRGKSVAEARAILAFAPRAVARDWSKLLESAVANAEHNHELVGDELRISAAFADEGPTLKRVRPRAMGRATPIHKRTSHLTITLTAKE